MSGSFAGSANVAGSVYIPGSKPLPLIPIEKYELNVDPNPNIITKKSREKIKYVQNVSLKFLRFKFFGICFFFENYFFMKVIIFY